MFSWFSSKDPTPEIPKKQKQWVTAQNGVGSLKLEEVDVPTPKDGEVLVKIQAVGVNQRDVDVCLGLYAVQQRSLGPTPPLPPCSDMVGTVMLGNSTSLSPGTRVIASVYQSYLTDPMREDDLASGLGFPLDGVLTQYRCFKAEGLVKVPGYLSDEEAVGLPTAGLTAWVAVRGDKAVGETTKEFGKGGVKRNQDEKPTVLVQGTDGVSLAGLQIAHATDQRTIITASSDSLLDRAKNDLSADMGINFRTHWEWQEPVLEATSHRGASVILETSSGPNSVTSLKRSLECVAFGGTIAIIGSPLGDKGKKGDGQPELHRLDVGAAALRRNATLRGVVGGSRERLEELVGFYEEKGIKPVVGEVFKWDKAREAFKMVQGGGFFGQVVIKVSG